MTGHLQPIREALSRIEEPEADDFAGGAGFAGRREARPTADMPEDCPVVPVGTEHGIFYFLTALGELRALAPDKVANKHIVAMFAPDSNYLERTWPRRKEIAQVDEAGKPLKDKDGNTLKEWVTVGWNTEIVSALLMDACATKGVWNPRERVRGRGAWRGDDGSLILHCGNHLLINGRWVRPGEYGGMVYPMQTPIPRPEGSPMARAEVMAPRLTAWLRNRGVEIPPDASPALLLLEILKTWNWARPMIDPVLLLGWLGAAMVGGALKYRPLAWVTGGAGSGKSTLLELIGYLFNGAILQSPKASEAGVRQTLGQQSLPVNLDESEADKDNSKIYALIELARLAATSQGNMLKGGQDHKATEFRAESCFLFSSILVPPMEPADRSRFAYLELGPLPAGSRSPNFDRHVGELRAIGAWLLKRFADHWHRWPALLEAYWDAMVDIGKQANRGADQFGTLRAAAELLLHDGEVDAEELALWGQMLGREAMDETSAAETEPTICLSHLRSMPVNLVGVGPQRLVSEWLLDATTPLGANPSDMYDTEAKEKRAKAQAALGRIGLKVVEQDGQEWLAVATNHVGLARLLQDTKFRDGVWTQALARLPGAIKSGRDRAAIRFAGHQSRCTLIPIAVALPGDDDGVVMAGREVEAA